MTELETLQRAKMYMDKLAAGIDPIVNAPVPPGDAIRNPRLSRCFHYISTVLDGAIAQERKRMIKALPPFHMAPQDIARLRPLDRSVRISEFADYISSHADLKQMRKLSALTITNHLAARGLLETQDGGKRPTERGIALGIFTDHRTGPTGDYTAVLYTPSAQQFILDHLSTMLEDLGRHGEARKESPSP